MAPISSRSESDDPEKILMMVGFLDNIVISSVFIFSLVASFQTKELCLIKTLKCPPAKNGIKTEAGRNDKKDTKNCSKIYSDEKNTIESNLGNRLFLFYCILHRFLSFGWLKTAV